MTKVFTVGDMCSLLNLPPGESGGGNYISPYVHLILAGFIGRGATTAEKLRGTKVWVLTPGRLRLAPGQRPGWVLGEGGGCPLPL